MSRKQLQSIIEKNDREIDQAFKEFQEHSKRFDKLMKEARAML